jgi:hypothetical protein
MSNGMLAVPSSARPLKNPTVGSSKTELIGKDL